LGEGFITVSCAKNNHLRTGADRLRVNLKEELLVPLHHPPDLLELPLELLGLESTKP